MHIAPVRCINRRWRNFCHFFWPVWRFDWLICQLARKLLTPPNFRVCARRKVPAKRFKICHILYIRKPKVAFSVFISGYFIFLPNECPGLWRQRKKYKIAQNEKRKKQIWVFIYLYEIWEILKCFAGTFRRAQTLNLGGVGSLSESDSPLLNLTC